MPTYDYRCTEHDVFTKIQPISKHASAECPKCGTPCKQVMIKAPGLDIEAMADIGMPGAFAVSGDRLTKRHRSAGQSYVHPEHR